MLNNTHSSEIPTQRLHILAALLLLWMGTLAGAQTPGDVIGLDPELRETPLEVASTGNTVAPEVTLAGLLRSGGWAMWPLGLFSIALIALAMYNAIVLRVREFCPPRFVEDLKHLMRTFELRSAHEHALGNPSYVGRMLSRSLPSIDPTDRQTLGREKFQEAVGDFALRANSRYMLWINYFSILAQAAPMLGLLGTVSGMIKAFSSMGREGMGDPTRLASHISEALVTTACGLMIALPALFCFFVFRNRLTQLISRCIDVVDELHDTALAATNPTSSLHQLPNGLDHESSEHA